MSDRSYHPLTRRTWIQHCAVAGLAGMAASSGRHGLAATGRPQKARIAITLDLEMSRNFPRWEDTFWDYKKGNLNDETKRYAVEAARRVKEAGGLIHFFAVGRVLEQENVDWLREIVRQGHPVGNHTYDHVNVLARSVEDVQYRFRRSPWLVAGKSPLEIIRENVRLCGLAMQNRLGVRPDGFRTPGGFSNGLRDRADVRALLREQGFEWVSSLYPPHANTAPGQRPDARVIDSIVAAQAKAQPFVYPDGLVEIPMSPISDIGAFRTGRWKLDWFLTAIREAVQWTIETGATFDFLGHPSCLYVVDPDFKAIDLICRMVKDQDGQAALVDLNAVASQITM